MSATLPFTVHGVAVPGKRLGTELGFPTANLEYPHEGELPESGVYVALAELDGQRFTAILSQGKHPTAPDEQPTIEAHLLDYDGGDLYGRNLSLTYVHFLRPEFKFSSVDALKTAIAKDRDDARIWVEQVKNGIGSRQPGRTGKRQLSLRRGHPPGAGQCFAGHSAGRIRGGARA